MPLLTVSFTADRRAAGLRPPGAGRTHPTAFLMTRRGGTDLSPLRCLHSLDLLRAAKAAVVNDHVRLRSIGDLLERDIPACRLCCLDGVLKGQPLNERLLHDLPVMLVPMPPADQSHSRVGL